MSSKKDKKDKHKANDKDAGTLFVSSKFECWNCWAI